eukprot:scaffold2638_cov114-Cylindrotheca_fusiformis.AAC.1
MGSIWSSHTSLNSESDPSESLGSDKGYFYLYTGEGALDAIPTSKRTITGKERLQDVTHVRIHPSVREIPFGAFEKCEALQTIEFPPQSSLKIIGENAFAKCTSLRTVSMPSTVTKIQRGAFQGCFALLSVQLSEGLVTIEDKAFYDCYYLRNVAIPKSVTEIGECAFENLKLNKVATPGDLTTALKKRFERLPIHELCYYEQDLSGWQEHAKNVVAEYDVTGSQVDMFGMTPLHIAVLSAHPNVELIRLLLQEFPESMLMKDEWGNAPLTCAVQADAPVDVVKLLVQAQEQRFPKEIPYWKGIMVASNKLASPELSKYLMFCSIAERLESLKLPAWRQAVLDMIDTIPDDKSQRKSKTLAIEKKVMWYEWKEKLSILEMALWQAKLRDLNEVAPPSSMDAADRLRCRVQCGDQVVIPNVLPFLGKYDDQHQGKKIRSIPLLPTPAPSATCPALRHL